jgi:hypothetical protein
MFLLSIIILGGLALYIFIVQYAYRALKKELPQNKKYIAKIVLAVFILLPVYDIVITNILGAYYCLMASPHPKTLITKKVEYPESIYWEDNIYPGFSKEDRELMIINYLDGVHLKTMALNGPDGEHVYVYKREVPISKYKQINTKLQNARKIFMQLNTRFKQPNLLKDNESLWLKLRDQKEEARKIVDVLENQRNKLIKSYQPKEKIYIKETMPKLNYTVTFNEVKLNPFSRHFLYSDETKVIENNIDKVIAYNRRYMRLNYMIVPNLQAIYYNPDPVCGDWYRYYLKVFDMLNWRLRGSSDHKIYINDHLYKKYIKGEK